jgi:hypothetical protein
MTLRESLEDWTDADGAAFALGILVGLFPPDQPWLEVKWMFWTDNPTGRGLHEALMALVKAGILEETDGESLFRFRTDVTEPERGKEQ